VHIRPRGGASGSGHMGETLPFMIFAVFDPSPIKSVYKLQFYITVVIITVHLHQNDIHA